MGGAVSWLSPQSFGLGSFVYNKGIKDQLGISNNQLSYLAATSNVPEKQKQLMYDAGFVDSTSAITGSTSYYTYNKETQEIKISGIIWPEVVRLSNQNICSLSNLLIMAAKGEPYTFDKQPLILSQNENRYMIDVQSCVYATGRYYWFILGVSKNKTMSIRIKNRVTEINKMEEGTEKQLKKLKLLKSISFVVPRSIANAKLAAGAGLLAAGIATGGAAYAAGLLGGGAAAGATAAGAGAAGAKATAAAATAATVKTAAGAAAAKTAVATATTTATTTAATTAASSGSGSSAGLYLLGGVGSVGGGGFALANEDSSVSSDESEAAYSFNKTKYEDFNFTKTDDEALYKLIEAYIENNKNTNCHTAITSGNCRRIFVFNGIEFDCLETTIELGQDPAVT